MEGQNPTVLVLCACTQGVVIDHVDAAWVQELEGSMTHVQATWAEFIQPQRYGRQAELQGAKILGRAGGKLNAAFTRVVSTLFRLEPEAVKYARYTPPRTMHDNTDWTTCARIQQLTSEQIGYCVMDAIATLYLHMHLQRHGALTATVVGGEDIVLDDVN